MYLDAVEGNLVANPSRRILHGTRVIRKELQHRFLSAYLKYNAERSILQAALQNIRWHFQADPTEAWILRDSRRETWRTVNAVLLRLDEVMWDNYEYRNNRDNVCWSFLLSFVHIAEPFISIRSILLLRKKRGDNCDQCNNILWHNHHHHHVVTCDLHNAIFLHVAKRLRREASWPYHRLRMTTLMTKLRLNSI